MADLQNENCGKGARIVRHSETATAKNVNDSADEASLVLAKVRLNSNDIKIQDFSPVVIYAC